MKFNMTINFTKFIAFTAIVLGTILSIVLKEASPFMSAMGAVMIIVGARDVVEKMKFKKKV